MCKWGTWIPVRVKVAASLSHTGRARWTHKQIDACIAPIVAALSEKRIHMLSSCCGHGKRRGHIMLADGRTLIIGRTHDR